MKAAFRIPLTARLACLFVIVISIAAPFALADDLYARIRGVVTDINGAIVPDVSVKATNLATGFTKTVSSTVDGTYEFVQLPVGTYKLSASKTGFKSFETSNITLVLNQTYFQKIALQVGQVSETITVEANSAQVETTSIQLGSVISGEKIVDMPLNGRNWIQLQQLQPGVVGQSDRFGSNYATNGSQSQQNSYLINGTDANDLPLNSPLVIPSPDAIAEFNLVTNTINPEYGRNSGAILNAVIRSGTNNFHGSAFEFYRDTFLNSTAFFKKKPDIFHQNQFGGTVGGPIWRNHSFFFFSYQGTRNRQPQTGFGNTQVLTAAERNGQFAGLATSKGTSPFPLVGDNGATFPAGTPYSTIFSQGFIPAADLNPISSSLLSQFVPLPNSGTRDFLFNPITSGKTDQYIGRLDHTFGPADSIFAYVFFQSNPTTDTLPFTGANLPGFGDQSQRHIKQYTAAWNHTFGANTLNEFRLGYTRFNFDAVEPIKPVLPSSVGFTGITPQNPKSAGIPTIALSGLFTLGFSDNGPQPRIDQTYQLTDNFAKVVGRHSLKMGFEVRRFQVDNPFFAINNGHFDFLGIGTYTTGVPGADFLLGIPDDFSQGSGGFIRARAEEYYSYFQDQFKVRDNLTLTMGTGYQVDTPVKEITKNNFDCFIVGQQSKRFPTAPLGLNFPGDSGCNESGGPTTKYTHFGPRFGFAYSPDLGPLSGGAGKLSIRGGYGIYFNRSEEELTLQALASPPFGITSGGIADVGGDPGFANPYKDVNPTDPGGGVTAINNKFPFTPPAAGSAVDFSIFEPFSISTMNPSFSTPYSQNYNLTVQRELPSRMILSVGYVGALGRRLIRDFELNPGLNPQGCLTQSKVVSGRTVTCAGSRTSQSTSFPQNFKYPGNIYGSIGQQYTNGSSNYNSMQVSLNKAESHGLSYLLSYTWSHSMDNGSSFENSGFGGQYPGANPFREDLLYSDSGFDARHRFVASYTYRLPSLHINGLVDRIIGGWSISGITTLQSGFPLGVRDRGFTSLTCPSSSIIFYACWDNPSVIGPIKTFDPRDSSLRFGTRASQTGYFFDPNAFARAPSGTFGNARRTIIHGPGTNNTDLVLAKSIRVTETKRFELRLEGYNAFNHTQFDFRQINTDFNSSNFGRELGALAPRQVQLGAKFYF